MKILCLIPARSGSKGIKNKNILIYKGLPMLAWSIKQAQESIYNENMRIILSTDSDIYRKIGIEYGAEAPFLRPENISGDLSTDYECVEHCVNYLDKEENYRPDFIIQLRPTYPTRNVNVLNDCIKKFIENRYKFDSLRTVIPFEKSPYKMYNIIDNKLVPLFHEIEIENKIIKEPYNECRQKLPQTYLHNGYIDIFNYDIVKNGTITGERIYPYLMDKNEIHDIDTLNDLKLIE